MRSVFMSVIAKSAGPTGLAAILLLGSAALAQAPNPPSPPAATPNELPPMPERLPTRQPRPSTPPTDIPPEAQKQIDATERKMREFDRKMNRVLRSICIGC
jgi:hypothetical protein